MPIPATTHNSKFSSRSTSHSGKFSARSSSHAEKFIGRTDTYLLQENASYLLLESGFKILITSPTHHTPKFA